MQEETKKKLEAGYDLTNKILLYPGLIIASLIVGFFISAIIVTTIAYLKPYINEMTIGVGTILFIAMVNTVMKEEKDTNTKKEF